MKIWIVWLFFLVVLPLTPLIVAGFCWRMVVGMFRCGWHTAEEFIEWVTA
jgi:hypothetical protein